MGRYGTGAVLQGRALKIRLGWFIENSCLKPGYESRGQLTWKPDVDVTVGFAMAVYEGGGCFRLAYQTGDQVAHTEIIQMVTVPSNLGKGQLYYFVCPVTGRRCRTLFRCYGSSMWKSRDSYDRRLYYGLQQSSKLDKANDRYWELECTLIPKLLKGRRKQRTYNGTLTKRARRLDKLEQLQRHLNHVRWSEASMTIGTKKALATGMY